MQSLVNLLWMRKGALRQDFCSRLLPIRHDFIGVVRATIVSFDTNLRQSGGIGANCVKKLIFAHDFSPFHHTQIFYLHVTHSSFFIVIDVILTAQ